MQQPATPRQFIDSNLAMECPFCGSNHLALMNLDEVCYVSCCACNINGPYGKTDKAAKDLWNRLEKE